MIRLRWLSCFAAATSLLAADRETYPREYNQLWAMVDGGRPLDAVPGLKTLIDNHPEFFRAYRTLAHACAQTACRTDAETHFRRQRSGRLAAAAGHFGLGEIYTRRAQYRSAAYEYVACIRAAAEAHYCYTMLAYALSADGRGRGPATDVVQFGHLDPARPETAVAKASQLHLRLKIPLAKTELLQVLPRVEETQNREFVAEARREAANIFSPSDSYYPQAMSALRASLDSAQAVDDRPMELDLLAVSAGSYAGTGDIETAVRNYESGIELAHSLGAKQAEGRYRELLGIDLAAAGRHQESIESYLAAAALFRELGSPGLEANALIHLGDGQKAHGDLRDAFQTYEEARRLAGTDGYKWYDAMALRGMSAISADRGEYSKALEYGEQSVRLFREVGSWSPAGAGEGMLGAYHAQLGDFDQASRSLTVSLGSARRASDAGEEARILAGLGRLAGSGGQAAGSSVVDATGSRSGRAHWLSALPGIGSPEHRGDLVGQRPALGRGRSRRASRRDQPRSR